MIAASTLNVVLVHRLTSRLFDQRVARIAGWIAAAYPPALALAGQPYSDDLAATALLAGALLLLCALRGDRARWWLAAGLALSVGVLVRPSAVSGRWPRRSFRSGRVAGWGPGRPPPGPCSSWWPS